MVGARPQFIKLAVLSPALRRRHREVIIHTGQHYDRILSDVFFRELSIPRPDYNLGIGSGEQGEQIGRGITRLEKVLEQVQPDLVLVYGDTNSTLIGAVTAKRLGLQLGHVEAGLRSYRMTMPEEQNRVVADHLADLLFCPTPTAVKNLKLEGVTKGVYRTGDLMLDAVKKFFPVAKSKVKILGLLGLQRKGYFLVTIHRAENTDNSKNLRRIVELVTTLPGPVIFPVHPRTRKELLRQNLWRRLRHANQVQTISPVSYLEMLVLIEAARIVLTDSGGVQKEAYFLRTPCLTLRDETEWLETLEGGWNRVVGLVGIPKRSFAQSRVRPTPRLSRFGGGRALKNTLAHLE